MESSIVSRGSMGRHAKAGAIFGILSGILIVVSFLTPTPTANLRDQLANLDRGFWTLFAAENLLLIVFGVLFAAYLRDVLEMMGPRRATGAAAFLSLGIVVGVGLTVLEAAAMLALAGIYTDAASTPTTREAAGVMATLLQNTVGGLIGFIVPVAFLSIGVVLFSVGMFNSKVFPNWVADVGIGSAVVALVAVIVFPYVSLFTSLPGFVILFAYIVLLLAWIFASSAFLWRSGARLAVAAPAPA